MTPQQNEAFVASVIRLKRSGRTYYFWMCAKGEDGLPMVLVQRQKGPLRKKSREARKRATVKLGASGQVHFDEGQLVWALEEGQLQAKQVRKLFRTRLATDLGLKRVASLLRKAAYLDPEAQAARTPVEQADATEDGDLEDLYRRAEEALESVDAALGGLSEHVAAIERMTGWLRRAGDVLASGEHEVARSMLVQVLEECEDLLPRGFSSELSRVEAKVARARELHALMDGDEGAFTPLELLLSTARTHGDRQEWIEGIDLLEQVEGRLDTLQHPLQPLSAEELAVLASIDELIDASALDEDDLPDPDYASLSAPELGAVVAAVQASSAISSGLRAATSELRRFLAGVRGDPELLALVGPETEARMLALLPDVEPVLQAASQVVRSPEKASLAPLRQGLDTLATDLEARPRLRAIELSDLGPFEIASRLRTALNEAHAVLS